MNRENFSRDWQFCPRGETAVPVTLPHDATLREQRTPAAPGGAGSAYFPGGYYEYRKTFPAPAHWKNRAVSLFFEGVYPTAEVFLNGVRVGGCAYGYRGFTVPLDGLMYGKTNELMVLVDHTGQPDSRWYAGAGIYRPVWLLEGGADRILHDGIRVTTLSVRPARIRVETAHTGDAEAEIVISRQGRTAAVARGNATELTIGDAALWSAEHPALYRCTVTLRDAAGRALDADAVDFGLRSLAWSAKEGLRVNGESVLLKGGCLHSDNGILGACSYAEAEWRRIQKLKSFGFNAIRSAHNPLCRAALEACDALGMYVMDEAWDMWDKAKTAGDYAARFAENYRDDLLDMTAKDYNHPSVLLYSIGNEVTEPARPEGVALAAGLVKTVRQLDATRPVTAGINLTLLLLASLPQNPLDDGGKNAVPPAGEMNSTAYNEMVAKMGRSMTMAAATEGADTISSPVLDLLDVAGYNYASSRYAREGELHPNRLVVGSETYPCELAENWAQVEAHPYLIGDFMWTAWDYLGEVGIGGWSYDPADRGFAKPFPWLLAETGVFDILGHDNAEAGLAAAVWRADTRPYIGVCPVNHPGIVPSKAIWRGSNALPYWSYRGCGGNPAKVEVYTSAPAVELFVNGRSEGCRAVSGCKAVFETVYEPGTLRAVACGADGQPAGETSLRSAEGALKIAVRPEKTAGPGDVLFVEIELVGENGEIECNCDTLLTVEATGGELLGFGSANPKTEESFLAGACTTYYGRSLAVLRPAARGGAVTLTVRGAGLETVVCGISASNA